LNDKGELYCFQPPCGGNVYIITSSDDMIMIDTGYGIYYQDFLKLFQNYGIDVNKLKNIYITHADADHSGAAGFYDVKTFMHKGTMKIIEEANRAYGSNAEKSVLEEVYTKLINLFSKFNPPSNVETFNNKEIKWRGSFPVIHTFKACNMEFEVLESFGGHLYGQIYILCMEEGLLFTADSLINFESLSKDRKKFNLLAKDLMTSVNVDGENAKQERIELLKLVSKLNNELSKQNKKFFVCGGHGTISTFSDNNLEVYGKVNRLKN